MMKASTAAIRQAEMPAAHHIVLGDVARSIKPRCLHFGTLYSSHSHLLSARPGAAGGFCTIDTPVAARFLIRQPSPSVDIARWKISFQRALSDAGADRHL